jgi:hypothetical protein
MADKKSGVTSSKEKIQQGNSRGAREATRNTAPDSPGGIFDGGLASYRTVTASEYRSLLTGGLVVPDANVLLNLYRYHPDTRQAWLEILEHLTAHLWVPHHAMKEFFRHRESVIEDQSQELNATLKSVGKVGGDFEKLIRTWSGRLGLSGGRTSDLLKIMKTAVDSLTQEIQKTSTDDTFESASDTVKDPVVQRLELILAHGVGKPSSPDELRDILKEGYQRIQDKRPPGYMDARKPDNATGDYQIWFQTLKEAKFRGVPVLFITGDVKEDWWRIDRGQAKGPRPELVYEMQQIAGVKLFMLRPESLLKHAGDIFGITISEESIEDVQRVSGNVSTANMYNFEGLTSIGTSGLTVALGTPTTTYGIIGDQGVTYYPSVTYGSSYEPGIDWWSNLTGPSAEPIPSRFDDFISAARSIAGRESANLSARYDKAHDTLILDTGNWPVSFSAARQIAAKASTLGVTFQLIGPLT